jgi:hypothetical protein
MLITRRSATLLQVGWTEPNTSEEAHR